MRFSLVFILFQLVAFVALAQQTQKPCQVENERANAFAHRFDKSDSLRLLGQELLDCAELHSDDESMLEALSIIGAAYFREANYPNALKYFSEANNLAESMNDSNALALTFINLGNVQIGLDSVPKAMRYMTQAATILESVQDSVNLSAVYNSMAHIMGKVGNSKRQLHYSQLAFDFVGRDLTKKRNLRLAVNYAINLSNNGDFEGSEALSLRVLNACREVGYTKALTQVLNHLANLKLKQNEPVEALAYAKECLQFEEKINHPITFNTAYTHLGMAYFELDSIDEAIVALEKAREIGEEESTLHAKRKPLRYLNQAYKRKGRMKEAYQTLLLYNQLNDSLMAEENIRIVEELKSKYETEKKEQQVRELTQQNQISELRLRQRSITIIVVLILALILAGGIYFVSRQRLLKEQQEALENRLLSLRVQLNPHFIFNALTAVQNYMLSGKDLKQAVRYLSNFAKVMRAFLEYNQAETITLDKELHAMGLYVGIQELRFSNGFMFDVHVDDAIISEETLVPPMILQPLIENAIEHGIRNVENGRIELHYSVEGESLIMRLCDNGIGRKRAAESPKTVEKTSLATKITNERIQLLNRKHKGRFQLEIRDANQDGTGTEVTVRMPLMLD